MEIRILDHLRRRDKDGLHNVIHMLDYFYFRSHLCISFELLRYIAIVEFPVSVFVARDFFIDEVERRSG